MLYIILKIGGSVRKHILRFLTLVSILFIPNIAKALEVTVSNPNLPVEGIADIYIKDLTGQTLDFELVLDNNVILVDAVNASKKEFLQDAIKITYNNLDDLIKIRIKVIDDTEEKANFVLRNILLDGEKIDDVSSSFTVIDIDEVKSELAIIDAPNLEFHHDQKEYKINVGYDVNHLNLNLFSFQDTLIEVIGNSNFKPGENLVTINSTFNDDRSTYQIKVIKAEQEKEVITEESACPNYSTTNWWMYLAIALFIISFVEVYIIYLAKKG